MHLRRAVSTLLLLMALSVTVRADPITAYIATHAVELIITAILATTSFVLSYVTSRRPKPGDASRPDLQLTTSREGEGVPRVYGNAAVGGKVIWLGGVTTRSVSQGSGKRSGPPTTAYSCSFACLVCENLNNSILGITRIYANGNVLYQRDASGLTGFNPGIEGTPNSAGQYPFDVGLVNARKLQVLLGREDQTTRCPWYTSGGDDADYVAYRGSVVVWFDDMDLTPSYNQIPQLQFEVLNANGTVAEIVTAECNYAGLLSAQINNGAPVVGPMGYIIDGPTPPKSTFELLSIYAPFEAAEVDGKLKFISYPQPSAATVTDGDLAAVLGGREESREEKPVKFAMVGEQSITEVVQRVEVTFFDPAFKYEEATAGYGLQFGAGVATKEVFMPMSSTRTVVRNIASGLLARSRTETDSLSIMLPPKYIKYHPGDVLSIPAPNGQVVDLRIINMEYAPGDPLKVDGVRQLRSQGVGTPDEGTPGTTDGPSAPPLDTIFILSNAPPLVDDHDGFDGIYWAAGPRSIPTADPKPSWTGASLYRNANGSDDANKLYLPLALTRTAAVIGKARTALADGSGVDTTHTVDIEFSYGEGTRTVLGIHNDAFTKTTVANLAILGKEVIQFRDVISDVTSSYPGVVGKVWRLGTIKRGIRDTGAMTGTHAVGEGFVLYSPDSLLRVPLDIIEQDNTWNFKALTLTQQETDADPVAFEYDPDDGTLVLWDTP